jgi:hypothetical protein
MVCGCVFSGSVYPLRRIVLELSTRNHRNFFRGVFVLETEVAATSGKTAGNNQPAGTE